MNEELVDHIKNIIGKLREMLLCPICSEVIQHSLELDCGHKFCESCFEEYAADKRRINCPVCKQHVKKQSTYGKDSYADALGKFIYSMSNVSASPETEHIPGVERAESTKMDETKNCEDLYKQHRKLNNPQNMEEGNVPKPAKSSKEKKKMKEDKLKNSKHSKNPKLDNAKPDDPRYVKENNVPRVDPAKSSRGEKKDRKSFKDSKNRQLVQDWLCATQNVFNGMTQTQPSLPRDELKSQSFSEVTLPSVSQRISPRPAPRQTRAISLDGKDRSLSRVHSNVLKVIDNYGIEDVNLKEQQVVQEVREAVLNKVKESEFLNELEEKFKGIEDGIVENVLDHNEEKEEIPKKSKISPGGWKRIEGIMKTVKCSRTTPKQLNVTVNTLQSSSSKKLKKSPLFPESSLKESHMTDLKSKTQQLNISGRKLTSSTLQQTLGTLPFNIPENSEEEEFYIVPTQKLNNSQLEITDNDSDNFIDELDLTWEDKLMVFEEQLKYDHLKRMFHEIIYDLTNFITGDGVKKATASVQPEEPITCNQPPQISYKNVAVQCDLITSNAQVRTDPKHTIPEEVMANSLDNIVFDTEDIIGKKTKKHSHNLKASNTPENTENRSAFEDAKPSTSGIKRQIKRNSNSDEEIKPVKKKNRFLKEDLSIEFACTAQVQNLETCATEGINYDEYTRDMPNHESESPIFQKQPVWEECEDIIANVKQNVNKLAKNNIASLDGDVISESEPFEPLKKKRKLNESETGTKTPERKIPTQNNNRKESGNLFSDDDFDNELEKIEIPNSPKIKIISNIPIKATEAEGDQDVIDATPPHKQNYDEINTAIDMLYTTIPPPLDFQDVLVQQEETDITQLSEENVETQLEQNSLLSAYNIEIKGLTLDHSTPLPGVDSVRESANLSPVSRTVDSTIRNKTQRSPNIMTSVRNQQSIRNFINISSPMVKPCIASSRLNSNQITQIQKLQQRKLAKYTASFTDDVTHLIIGQNSNDMVTIKFILGVASGIWILKYEWINECLAQDRIVPEESYESLDDKGGTGPKTARMKSKTDPLFKKFKFYFCFNKPSDMENGITAAVMKLGGTIFNKIVDMTEKDGKTPVIIVEDRLSQTDLYRRWTELYNIPVIDLEWLGICIARYRIVGILNYTCSSLNTLRRWKYPNYLLFSED